MKKFKQIYLEISPKCNLNCSFCPYSNNKIVNGLFWNNDIIEKAIKNTIDYTDDYYLHVLGEPLLNPNLKDIFEVISKYNKNIKITTNGLLLKNNMDLILSSYNIVKINISFESWINFSKDKIDLLISDIVEFINKKEEHNKNITIELRFWNNKEDSKVIDFNNYIIDKFNEYGINLKEKHIRPYLITSYHDEFKWPDINDCVNNNLNKCLGGINQLGILNNGDVVLCCLDYSDKTKIGNIFENDLNYIINDQLYTDFSIKRRVNKCYFELCSKCTFRDKFN